MLLGSGVVQVGTRSPVVVAQTAITLSNLSNGRFLLGVGASGPQVVEGLHGVSFSRPLSRIRETVDIVRQMFSGGKISYSRKEFQIPRPGGEAVPMRLSTRPEHHIPIYLAALSPAMLRLTGEIADGWLAPASCPKEPQTLTLPTLTPGWPPPGALGRTSTSAKAPKSLSPQTKTNCAGWSRAAKKSSPSVSAACGPPA
jgi:alkanesulfonate monooxygenase SsuD/methylene tetrahydromethanopterin reductase-like flavin-dependent oxidoreductase (luciferase family)